MHVKTKHAVYTVKQGRQASGSSDIQTHGVGQSLLTAGSDHEGGSDLKLHQWEGPWDDGLKEGSKYRKTWEQRKFNPGERMMMNCLGAGRCSAARVAGSRASGSNHRCAGWS